VLAFASLVCAAPSYAAEPDPDPHILALTLEELRVESLYTEDLSQPLSGDALSPDNGIVGRAAHLLMTWNGNREEEVVSFINDSFVPALLTNRDDFVCRRTRAFYADLLQQADAYLKKTGRDSSFRKYAAMCNCLSPSPLRHWWNNDVYYFLMLSWDGLEERNLTVRTWIGEGVATRGAVEEWMSLSYDMSTPCGAPWAPTEH